MALYYDGVLHVDNTILSSFATCPTYAVVRYHYNKRPFGYSNNPMIAGSALHKAIEQHYQGKSREEVVATLWEHYYEYATQNIASDDRYSWNNISAVLISWIMRHPVEQLPYTVPSDNFTEIPFAYQLDPNVPDIVYVGMIDAVVAQRAGSMIPEELRAQQGLYVLDTKSTGRLDESFKKSFHLSSQMSGYVWAANFMFPEQEIVGVYINGVATTVVPTSDRKCSVHKRPYSECGFMHPAHELLGPFLRTPEEIEEWRWDAVTLAREWKRQVDQQGDSEDMSLVPQTGKFVYGACSRCELLDFCRLGRPLKTYDWEHYQWLPGNLAER